MERRRKTGPRVTTSRLDPSDYDASPFAISMYPNIDEFTEHGQIVIGYIEPVGAVAIASEGRQTIPCSAGGKTNPSNNCSPGSIRPSQKPPSTMSTSTKSTPRKAETHTSYDRSCPLELIVDTYGPIHRKTPTPIKTARTSRLLSCCDMP